MSDTFTVIGARGFLGSAIVAHLRARGDNVIERRSDESATGDRGHVIYASGVAWGGDERHLESYEIHVERARRALESGVRESFTYISSTRVYDGAGSTREDATLWIEPAARGATYKHSKIAGETLVLGIDDPRVRLVRASNLAGPHFRSGLFLSDVLRGAVREGVVRVRTSRESSKDYVNAIDVARLIAQIARSGKYRIYNIARGENTTNGAILDAIAATNGARIEIEPGSPTIVTPRIDIQRLSQEFDPPRLRVEDSIAELVTRFAEAELARNAR
ncbi:MAG TPA: NAD-dependent epimerase/dehydratase family protein [Candidatus Baltobacteraceae bacterium]|jgi:nucleoside-diphosphate-sugar epimerase